MGVVILFVSLNFSSYTILIYDPGDSKLLANSVRTKFDEKFPSNFFN